MGVETDLRPGEVLVDCFRPFIEQLASSSLSAKTIRRHVDNLWSLGGEIIRELHYDPSLRRRPPEQLLREAVHEYGGPSVHNASEEHQSAFDATCRKLYRFFTTSSRRPFLTHKFPRRGIKRGTSHGLGQ
jgi:hypothetical protein